MDELIKEISFDRRTKEIKVVVDTTRGTSILSGFLQQYVAENYGLSYCEVLLSSFVVFSDDVYVTYEVKESE